MKRRAVVFTTIAIFGLILAHMPLISAPEPVENPPDHPLVWDALVKSNNVPFGHVTNRFVFWVTNSSLRRVTITNLLPSCGCTVAELPKNPWLLRPGVSGPIQVEMSVVGKVGAFTKTLAVQSTAGQQTLTMTVNVPETTRNKERAQNLMQSQIDAFAIFSGTCADCHVKKGAGKKGAELFAADCGICHEAEHRAEMVPDLGKLGRPTPPEYWKVIITSGKPTTLMPAFGKKFGGPLTDDEIDSLVEYLVQRYPSTSNPPNAKSK